VAVLAGHQVQVVRLDFIANKFSLWFITILNQSLQQPAAIMLKAKLCIFLTYLLY